MGPGERARTEGMWSASSSLRRGTRAVFPPPAWDDERSTPSDRITAREVTCCRVYLVGWSGPASPPRCRQRAEEQRRRATTRWRGGVRDMRGMEAPLDPLRQPPARPRRCRSPAPAVRPGCADRFRDARDRPAGARPLPRPSSRGAVESARAVNRAVARPPDPTRPAAAHQRNGRGRKGRAGPAPASESSAKVCRWRRDDALAIGGG